MTTKEKLLKEKENILASIDNRNKRLNEIDNLIKEIEEQGKKWKIEIGKEYYYLNNNGTIGESKFDDDRIDRKKLMIGNYFKTKEEAEFEVERLKIIEELKEFAYEFSDEEWKNSEICKYSIVCDCRDRSICMCDSYFVKKTDLYFKSLEDMKKAIEKVRRDRVIKYYFRIGKNEQ